jgi:hypothetical protein
VVSPLTRPCCAHLTWCGRYEQSKDVVEILDNEYVLPRSEHIFHPDEARTRLAENVCAMPLCQGKGDTLKHYTMARAGSPG